MSKQKKSTGSGRMMELGYKPLQIFLEKEWHLRLKAAADYVGTDMVSLVRSATYSAIRSIERRMEDEKP